jgi:chromosomal replication initiation ATPase DnaA
MERMMLSPKPTDVVKRDYFTPIVPASSPLPPIPNYEMERACDILSSGPRIVGEVERIQMAVCKHFDIALNDMKSARRTSYVVRPRQIAIYLAKELTGRSLPEIGKRFGGRDHTTVLHAVRRIKDLVESDGSIADDVRTIKATLTEVE